MNLKRMLIIAVSAVMLLSGMQVVFAGFDDDLPDNGRQIIDNGLSDPRIAVIIPEYHIAAPIPDPAGETAVIRKLVEAGFTRVVDAQRVQQIRYTNVIKALAAGNKQEARAIAADLGVDYLIVGEGFSQYVGNIMGSGVVSSRARVEARMFRADNGEIIAANGFHAGGADITEFISAKKALNNAGELMGDYMVQQLMKLGSKTEKNVKLMVRNVSSFENINVLERELRKIPGVTNVFVCKYDSRVSTIDVNYSGSARGLAAAMANMNNVSIGVSNVSEGVVEAILR